jgi:hypothetical protein
MAELTKEYFDQRIGDITQRFDGVASKADLQGQTKELKAFAEEQTDALARIIATTVAEPMERHFEKLDKELDMYAEVKQLKADMERIKEALHLSPSRA